jgi:hypothetical protein
MNTFTQASFGLFGRSADEHAGSLGRAQFFSIILLKPAIIWL